MLSSKNTALILAAGYSKRFGADKRLHVLPNGNTLLEQSIYNAIGSYKRVFVVLRNDDDAISKKVAQLPVQLIHAPLLPVGMGESLSCGVAHVVVHCDCQTISILHADLPMINPSTLIKVVQLASSKGITLPVYRNQQGHPVVFGADYFPDLMQLSGEQGGCDIIKNNQSACTRVTVDDPGICCDIDRTEDALLSSLSWEHKLGLPH